MSHQALNLGKAGLLGWRLLVPGAYQRSLGQTERGRSALLTYVCAVAVAAFSWGTPLAFGMLLVAVIIHLISVCDALSQHAFPGFARGIPVVSVAIGLCFAYVPCFMLGLRVAGSERVENLPNHRYLLNRLAFETSPPRPGDWVAYHPVSRRGVAIGRVVACGGQEVRCVAGDVFVDGARVGQRLFGLGQVDLSLTVPEGHALVLSDLSNQQNEQRKSLVLVSNTQVIGRPWLQVAPLSELRLLL